MAEILHRPDPSPSMDLVRKFQGGDGQALNELFERYKPRLKRIVHIRLAGRLQRFVDEDDIVQDVFLVAMGRVRELQLEDRSSLLRWLAKIARNEILGKAEFYSAQKRDPGREIQARGLDSSSEDLGQRLAASGASPSAAAAQAEFQELIDSYVVGLDPPEYREVVLLRDYQDES